MAKTCKIALEKSRLKRSQLAYKRRQKTRNIIKSHKATYEEKVAAVIKLNKMPRNESAIRVQRRCRCCGRPRAVYRKFGLCRICLRQLMMRGDVTGLVKASW